MAMDIVGFIVASVATGACSVSVWMNYMNYRRFQIAHFMYGAILSACLGIWTLGYVINSLFLGPEYTTVINQLQLIFIFPAILGFALLVPFSEATKQVSSEQIIRLAFFGAGAVAIGHFLPGMFQLSWSNQGWIPQYEPALGIGMMFYFIGILIAVIPLFLRSWQRSRVQNSYNSHARGLLLFVMLSGVATAGVEFIRRGLIGILPIMETLPNLRVIYLISMSMLMLSFGYVLWVHPTIFFAGSSDPCMLLFSTIQGSTPLYIYSFNEDNMASTPELISSACTGIRQVMQEVVNSKGELKTVTMGKNEVLITQGQQIIGVLITERSSPILAALLRLVTYEFEHQYGEATDLNLRYKLGEFTQRVTKYFEFILPTPGVPITL